MKTPKTLIFSYFVYKDGPSANALRILDLWHRHLRGPGQYEGDIALCTNLTSLPHSDIALIPTEFDNSNKKALWCERILRHDRIPAQNYDQVFQFDIDILAVAPLTPLFVQEGDHHLYTASSLYPSHWKANAGVFCSLPQRFYLRYLSPERRQLGYSAAIFGCRSEHWTAHLSKWASLIESYQGPPPPLGDQSFLNLAAIRRLFPIQAYPLDVVQQQNWAMGDKATVFHFGGIADRVGIMEKYAIA